MSVLYLVPDLIGQPGGIARYCRHVSRVLSESGKRVTVIALRDDSGSNPEAEGIVVADYIPCARRKHSFVRSAVVAALRRRPDLILCGHPNFGPLAFGLSRAMRIPYAVFLYGTDSWVSLPGLRGWALRRADRCVAISEHTARLARRANRLDANKIEILYNCLDPNFRLDAERTVPRRRAILTVGRITTFEPLKGQELVLEAMPRLLEMFPDLVYDVVGDGDRRPALQRLAAELNVDRSVRFHGVVSDEELSNLYSSAAVFVMPSTVEGFGFVFAEAMAYGTPAIGGNRDAGPEVIIDGKTGFVIDPTSVSAVVDAVSSVLQDRRLWEEMSRAAVEHARSKFTFQRFTERFLEILYRLTHAEQPVSAG